jgi:hypothetical protein
MRKGFLIFIAVFLLFLLISLAVYFLFLKKSKETISQKPFDKRSEIAWNALGERVDVIKTEGYPENLLEFLDTLHGKERYEWGQDRDRTFLYLNTQFPDERGSVLYAIYVSYSFYLEEIEALELDKSRTNWEKLQKREEIRDHFFRGKLKEHIFPNHPSQKPLEFLYYAEDYCQKHPTTFAAERRRHLRKKRKELYNKNLLEIKKWEDDSFQRKILNLIFQREINLMTEYEKNRFIGMKLIEVTDGDFWN